MIWSPQAFTFSFPAGASYGDDGFGSPEPHRRPGPGRAQGRPHRRRGRGHRRVRPAPAHLPQPRPRRRERRSCARRPQQSRAGSGWKGAVGFSPPSVLQGTHNVAAFDIDKDGDKDLVIGRCTGTSVWMNTSNPCKAFHYGQANNNSTGQPALIGVHGRPRGEREQPRADGQRPAPRRRRVLLPVEDQERPVPAVRGRPALRGRARRPHAGRSPSPPPTRRATSTCRST